MYRFLFSLIFLCSISISFAQKQDYVWMSGQDYHPVSGVSGFMFDFNKKPINPEFVNHPLGFLGNSASICDKDGKLLFYTNGRGVMNKYYQIMPNGDSINAGEWADKLWPDPSRGYPGFQDVMILPDPGYEKGYYLFHKPIIYYANVEDSFQLHYSYIDLSLDNGNGDVTIKNKRYHEKQNLMNSFFTSINHINKKDWWIIQPIVEDSIFLTYLLNSTGIHRMTDQNTHQFFNKWRSSSGGTAKFSPDGTKYAIYTFVDQLHIYDFDRTTGILSNHKKVFVYPNDFIDPNAQRWSSVEWSPDSRFIYAVSNLELFQVDTHNPEINEAIILIDTFNLTQDPFYTTFDFMVQGPDCRIYISPRGGTYSWHVINKPNEMGKACDFVQNGIKLPNPNGNGTMPNFPRFRVDEEDKCDPTITSIFGDAVFYRRNIEVYPSPSSGVFNIKIPDSAAKANLIVTTINGEVIFKKEINKSQLEEVDITHMPSGRYNFDVYPVDNTERIFYGKQVVKI